jgi:hypothetical protein
VRLIVNERNAGFACAANQGLRLAAGRYSERQSAGHWPRLAVASHSGNAQSS